MRFNGGHATEYMKAKLVRDCEGPIVNPKKKTIAAICEYVVLVPFGRLFNVIFARPAGFMPVARDHSPTHIQ